MIATSGGTMRVGRFSPKRKSPIMTNSTTVAKATNLGFSDTRASPISFFSWLVSQESSPVRTSIVASTFSRVNPSSSAMRRA